MIRSLTGLADRWIGRHAEPEARALADVSGLAPAVVITGASRGIGLALAHRFARNGSGERPVLVLIARDRRALETAAQDLASATGARTVPVSLDVTHPDAPRLLDEALHGARLYCDVLVNNAGIGLAGPFAESSRADLEALIALNVTAATRLMHHVLPAMLGRGRGGILNMGSLGGLVPGPNQAAYYASKAYLISLTEAVAHEARGRGVRLSVVAPGPVDTSFHKAMRAEGALYRSMVPAMSADAVARTAYRGYRLGQTVIVPGVLASLASAAVKLLPHAVSVPLVGALLSVGRRLPERG